MCLHLLTQNLSTTWIQMNFGFSHFYTLISNQHGIYNSTTCKNGNGRRFMRELDAFQVNMGKLCGSNGNCEKKAAKIQVIGKKCLQIYKNLLVSEEDRMSTKKHFIKTH